MASKKAVKKEFSPELFQENDSPAREAIRQYIGTAGLFVQDNPDIYGPDLIVYKGFKKKYYAEVEVKRVWKSHQDTFPWKTIQLPARKMKFLEQGLPLEFFILREDLRMAVIIPDYIVLKSPQEEVKNKLVSSGEMFVVVDVAECAVVYLVD